MSSFGETIAQARKKKFLSQKELAQRIKKEDGQSISGQYLNDIEHDRRNAPSQFLMNQLAAELDLNQDHLCLLAGALPQDLKGPIAAARPDKVIDAFQVFRSRIRRK